MLSHTKEQQYHAPILIFQSLCPYRSYASFVLSNYKPCLIPGYILIDTLCANLGGFDQIALLSLFSKADPVG